MFSLLEKLVREESGQDLAEYGIALSVIVVAVGVIALAIGTDVTGFWTAAQTTIRNAV